MTVSPDMHSAPLRVDVGICTFRRPALEQTLHSLVIMAVPELVSMRIIIADNDTEPSARPLVEAMRATVPFEILYLHCPAANISIARNACLDNSDGDFLAFIDDDETASKFWLVNLLAVAEATGADAVLGPVVAEYEIDAPEWMRRGDFHSTAPVWVAGRIRTGYTCNALLRTGSHSLAGRRFKLSLGKSGGEDTDYFTNMHRAGGRIDFAADAIVHEPVPSLRARFSWLTRRRYRMGQTHGRLLAASGAAGHRLQQLVLAGAKLGFCALAAIACAPFPIPRNRYALRAVLHSGVVAGLAGVREIHQYGQLGTTAS